MKQLAKTVFLDHLQPVFLLNNTEMWFFSTNVLSHCLSIHIWAYFCTILIEFTPFGGSRLFDVLQLGGRGGSGIQECFEIYFWEHFLLTIISFSAPLVSYLFFFFFLVIFIYCINAVLTYGNRTKARIKKNAHFTYASSIVEFTGLFT